jgi:hypothetical protein
MNLHRVLIGSVVFLAVGLGLIFGYCHGTAAFGAAYPVAGTSLQVSVTTTGLPALTGFGFTVIGLALLIWAFVAAVLEQMPSTGAPKVING